MSDSVSNAQILAAITAGNELLTTAATERGELRLAQAEQAKDISHLQDGAKKQEGKHETLKEKFDILKTRVERLLAGVVVLIVLIEIVARWVPNPWGP